MDVNVRVTSDEALVRNARIEVRGGGGEWVDISRYVSAVHTTLAVGAVASVRLELVPVEVALSGRLDSETKAAMAALLEAAADSEEQP